MFDDIFRQMRNRTSNRIFISNRNRMIKRKKTLKSGHDVSPVSQSIMFLHIRISFFHVRSIDFFFFLVTTF